MNNRRESFAALLEALKPMSGMERLEHIWSYYKEAILIALIVVFLVVVTIISIANAGIKALFSGAFANVDLTADGMQYLQEDYFDRLGGKPRQEVRLTATYFENLFGSVSDFDFNYNSAMGIVAMVTDRSLDYMVMDEVALKFYLSQDIFMDLSEFFTEEELEQYADRLVYLEANDSDDRFPIAIHIEDTAFAKDCMEPGKPVFFALIGNTKRPELCRDFWEYLLAWEKSK